jgi:hypothetical protein
MKFLNYPTYTLLVLTQPATLFGPISNGWQGMSPIQQQQGSPSTWPNQRTNQHIKIIDPDVIIEKTASPQQEVKYQKTKFKQEGHMESDNRLTQIKSELNQQFKHAA